MLKIENTEVFGWEAAIRGMRNPMNSWEQSDTKQCYDLDDCDDCSGSSYCKHYNGDPYTAGLSVALGENDLKLMKTLAKAGSDHAKYLRMINVTMDVTAPMYWWKEFDTYKVGTVANSCSTMHKIHDKEFTLDDFSHEHLTYYEEDGELCRDWLGDLECTIDDLNFARKKFLECAEALKYNAFETWSDGLACKEAQKQYWWQMIQLLPSSYNQKRTVQLNYQVLKQMYFARRNHKLDEWHTLCEWMETLPYFKEICIDAN